MDKRSDDKKDSVLQAEAARGDWRSFFGPEDDGIHEPGPDSIWQESCWIYFGNGQGLGGVVHIGQEVNLGKANIFAASYAGDAAFRKIRVDYDLDRQVRASGSFVTGPYKITPISAGGLQISVKDEQFELELEFIPQSQQLRWVPVFPNLATHPGVKTASINYQAPGRVRGVMRLGDHTVDVNAFAQRGHSWGNRDHTALRGHGSRWVTGSFGDRLNFSAYVAIRGDGLIIRSGFVVDRGEVIHTSDIDIKVEVETDGVSYSSGMVRMRCPNHEYVFRCQLDNVNLFNLHGAEVSVGGGDLRIDGVSTPGYSAWEITDRPPTPLGGVPFSLSSFTVDGLQARP